jgi:molecular chaperone GrpE (heat shock protein)
MSAVGNSESSMVSFATVLSGLSKSISLQANDAAKQMAEVGARYSNEIAAISHDTAADMLKGLAPSLQAQQKQISDLVSRMDSIQKVLTDVSKYLNTERQEAMTELRNLRSNEFNREVVHPLLRQICIDAKDAIRTAGELRNSEGCEKAIDCFERFAANRQESLSTYGVSTFSAKCGEAFNPRLHEVVRREKKPTTDPSLHGRIAAEESPGFIQDEVVLVKSTVFVYEFVSSNQPALCAKES